MMEDDDGFSTYPRSGLNIPVRRSSVCCVVVRSVQSVVLHPRRGPRPHPVRPRAVPRVAWFPVDVAVVAREFVPEVSFQSRVAVEETGSNNRSLSGSTVGGISSSNRNSCSGLRNGSYWILAGYAINPDRSSLPTPSDAELPDLS
ncbi:uncharacterized protein LOC120417963 isoform X1 [Culex pipiens pallens]|uniref:uncharacterized protein LOC120417963 isoform X1 n=1 Tax=Culex pipiens pallens TaxID=42434 RepID=UPI001953DB19|nr:uncharacterized protein LOC120417963 isoform X1 [Culex pipiens pallens]